MSRHQTERNQFNRRIKPDSRFAPLPHEGEVRNEEEPCLTTPKDACGVLERFSRSSKQVLSGTENVGSVFRIMRRAEDAPITTAAPARRPPATAATLKHVIVGADGKPLPPSPARDRSRSRSRSRSRGRRRDRSRSRDRRRGRRRRDDEDRRERRRADDNRRQRSRSRRRDDEDARRDRRERSRGRARHRRSRSREHRDRRRSYS